MLELVNNSSRAPWRGTVAALLVLGAQAALGQDRLVSAYLVVRTRQTPAPAGRCDVKGKVKGSRAELNRTTVFATRARVRDDGILVAGPGADDEGTVLNAKGEFELVLDPSWTYTLTIESGKLTLQSLVSGCGLEVEASVAQLKP
jgi:hypothetical protein